MSNTVGIAREQEVFAVEETTKGTLVFPAASDLIVAAGFATVKQQPAFTDSPEIVNSRDLIEEFQDATPPGEWSCPIIARPSGSLGTAPNASIFYKSLFGTETVNASTSVVYTLAMTKPSFSLWVRKGHTVFFASGCTVGQAGLQTSKSGGVTWNMSGNFMVLGWAGTDELGAAASATDTTITVVDAKKYSVGARIELASDDNGGSGYEVTAVNTTTNVLTLGSAIVSGGSIGDAVSGFLPTGTDTSTALENRKSTAEIASTSLPIKSMSINIADSPQYLDDELTTSGYVEDYAEIRRTIDGSLSIYFRQDDLDYFHDGLAGNTQSVALVCGDTSGEIMTISMPTTRLAVPDVTETDPTIALDMPIKAKGSSGEDSISITFT